LKDEVFVTLELDKIIDCLLPLPVSLLGTKLLQKLCPSKDVQLIKKQLYEVTELREILDYDDPFPLSGLMDISDALKKVMLKGTFLLPEDLYKVFRTLDVARKIKFYFNEREEKYPHLFLIVKSVNIFLTVEKEISRCIDKSTFEVVDFASPELNRIRRSIEVQEGQIRKKLEAMLKSFSGKGYLQENLIAVRNERLVFMVKDESRGKVKGLVHDQSATGATLFVEPLETLELNNKIRALKTQERIEIEKILLRISDLIRENLTEIQETVDALGQLDFIYGKAVFSKQISGNQPAINDTNKMEIIKGKHPLLVLRGDTQREVVPLDVKLGEKSNTLVISGPNAGGKTVAIKTMGLLSLMTACGLHVPADPTSDIAIFNHIFATIGDQQSIENDLSTFSSHVAKLCEIINRAKKNDLILIDEIGAGTDPDEGASLAISILEHLNARGCNTVISTHQGALKVFAHETDGVENGSMEFDRETLEPTYHFRLGIPGSSYAFEIARRLGISEKITSRARELIGTKKNKMEELLIDLETKMQQYRSLTNELSIKKSDLDSRIELYEYKNDELLKKEKTFKKDAIDEAEQILKQTNAAVENAIKKIREEQASKEAIKHARESIKVEKVRIKDESLKLKTKKAESRSSKRPLTKVTLGQDVFWKTFQRNGIVLSKPDASQKVLIQAGDVKMKVPLNELFHAKNSGAKDIHRSRINIKTTISSLKTSELDIRGFTVDEGIGAVDKFLDEAIMSGLEQVYIIHGKGTGKLRKGIYLFLEKHPRVKGKEYPEWSLGDTGMTVVNLH
jgi:DNA mismatch repair protein MutS2